ncbi:MAG: tetratricopeptide repeat protein [Spirochaetaceae bacterium]|nr:tetratricopeptide repeat protein [Spirochaetaceae bacterium]
MKRLVYGAVLLFLMVSGCKSNPFYRAGRDFMYVMVYDYENIGIQGVSVYIDHKLQGETDVQGRYLLDLKKKKEHTITLQKRGYEKAETAFIFDPFLVLYFKMGNAPQFLHLAEGELENASYDGALDWIRRSLDLEPGRAEALYLKAIVYYRMGKKREALDILDNLSAAVGDNEYVGLLRELVNRPEDYHEE